MNVQTYYQSDYSGGLNDTASPIEISENEASVLQNWDITYLGQLVRRDGLTLIGANIGANPILALGSFIRDSGQDILAIESTNLWYLNSSTWTKIANSTTLTAGSFWFTNIQVKNRIYFCNEDTQLCYWDRAATTLNTCITQAAATVPHGNVMIWYKNFLFHLNNVNVNGTKYKHRAYFSALGDPDTYTTATNFFEVPGDGRLITAVDMGDRIVFFKERAIQYLSGYGVNSWVISDTASNVSNVDEQVGCLAMRGACKVGNEVWFIDGEANIRRLYQTDFDAFRRDIISTKIQGTLSKMNKSQLTKCIAWSNSNKVYFAFPNGTDTHNSIVCVFDIIASKRETYNPAGPAEAWTTYTGWAPSIFADYPTSTSVDMYIGDATTGDVYKRGGNDDNGTAIAARWDGKQDYYGQDAMWKRYKFGYIRGIAGSGAVPVDIYAGVDGGGFGKVGTLTLQAVGSKLGPTGSFLLGPTGSCKLGGNSQSEQKFLYPLGQTRGKSKTMSIRHNVAAQKPTINTYSDHFNNRMIR